MALTITKVCHLTSAHQRHDVRIFQKQCISLARAGYRVSLIVNDALPSEETSGVSILPTGKKPKNRLERIWVSQVGILRKAIEQDADIYQIHDPELLFTALVLSWRGKKVIFDSHEDTPSQILDKQWLPKSLRKGLGHTYAVFEGIACRRLTGIIAVTPHIVKKFTRFNENSVLVTNYPVVDSCSEPVRLQTDKPTICFAGGISNQWQHHKILEALSHVKDVHYLLAGSGDKAYLESLAQTPAWERVTYLGRIPHEAVKTVYEKSMAGLAINSSSQLQAEGSLGNTKIFEYMHARLPVICSNNRLWKQIVDRHKCGICVNPENAIEIAAAITYMQENPDEAKAMGERGRRAVLEEYNWASQERVLLELYKSI